MQANSPRPGLPPPEAAAAVPPVLRLAGISKRFGPNPVLRDVDFSVHAGEVHALMGENGAGKSTLMKIAGGLYPDYAGEIFLRGVPVRFGSPRDATSAGIALIHQELNLIPGLTADGNIFLGRERLRGPFIVSRRRQARAAAEILATLNFQAAPDVPVGTLRVGEQQLVEIAKALALDARVLIMDEPTSALSVGEAERLFQVIRRIAAGGVAVVYISHRLEEVFALADTLTVLRDGQRVSTIAARETTRQAVIRSMVGRDLQKFFDHRGGGEPDGAGVTPASAPALSVWGLWLDHPQPTPRRPRLVEDVSFDVAPGEVFGLGGLLGAGRTEVLATLFGAQVTASGGDVRVDGRRVTPANPAEAKRAGFAFVTEDRKRDGLILEAGIDRNVPLPVLPRVARRGVVSARRETALTVDTVARLGVRAHGPSQPVGTLSGGNQQKVVVGKWLLTDPRVLLLDEPTRGVDVGAKAEIYALVRELSRRGVAIVLVSSELPELISLSDRILVLREGRPAALLGRAEFCEETILEYASPGGPTQPGVGDGCAASPACADELP